MNDCASGNAARTFGGASSPGALLGVFDSAVVLGGAELVAVAGVVVLLVSLELEHAAPKPASVLARTSVKIFFISMIPPVLDLINFVELPSLLVLCRSRRHEQTLGFRSRLNS